MEKQQLQLSNWCNQKLILTDGATDLGKWAKKPDRDKHLEEFEVCVSIEICIFHSQTISYIAHKFGICTYWIQERLFV